MTLLRSTPRRGCAWIFKTLAALTAAGLLASCTSALPGATAGAAADGSTLRRSAADRRMDIGCEINGAGFGDPQWRELVRRQFNLAVVDWGFYWGEVESTRGNFDFSVTDPQFDFARSAQMKVRAHALVFPGTLPGWLSQSGFSKDELGAVLREHVSRIVGRYRGRASQWIVVNEPYIHPYRQEDVFYRALGYDYVEMAFRAARRADPAATLIYNDCCNETAGGVMTGLTRQMVRRLKSVGLIDGVGLQMHLDGASPPGKLDVVATMRSYGIPVHVTEFDVNLKDLRGTREQRYARQARIYKEMLEACLESGVCRSFSVWSAGDRHSWLENPKSSPLASPHADPALFDDDFHPKPAYFSLLEALR